MFTADIDDGLSSHERMQVYLVEYWLFEPPLLKFLDMLHAEVGNANRFHPASFLGLDTSFPTYSRCQVRQRSGCVRASNDMILTSLSFTWSTDWRMQQIERDLIDRGVLE